MNRKTAFILVIVALLTGVVFLTPYGLGYPTSDSMEPTLSQEDIYFVVPATNFGTGDIVVFDQSQTESGLQRSTVHRIVGETNNGYITQGDANERTDQETGAPPVTEKQIDGRVLTIGGQPVTVPNSYQLTEKVIQNSRLIGALGVLLVVLPYLKDMFTSQLENRDPSRPLQTGEVLTIVPIIVFISLVLFLYLTPSVHVWTAVATTEDVAEQSQINVPINEPVDEEVSLNYSTQTDFVVALPEIRGGTIQSTEYGEGTIDIQMEVGPYKTKGPKETQILFYEYPGILPADWIQTVHSVHPFVACLVVSGTVVFPISFLLLIIMPGGPMRIVYRLKILPFGRR